MDPPFAAITDAALTGADAMVPVKPAMALWLNFGIYSMFLQCAMFGVVYRYAVRFDDDDTLNQGLVAAFALLRTLASMQVYSSSDMWVQAFAYFGESALAFGFAASALEFAWYRGYAFRLDDLPYAPPPLYDRPPAEVWPPRRPDPRYERPPFDRGPRYYRADVDRVSPNFRDDRVPGTYPYRD